MSNRRILIASEEEQIRRMMSKWFSMHGFETDEAANGAEAVRRCEDSAYDVVMLDLDMPFTAGSEAIGLIKQKNPTLPIIVLTGYTSTQNDVWPNVERLFAKPVSLRHLQEQVCGMLAAQD